MSITTADLIKKREEEKNNPPQGMNMAEARMFGTSVPPVETAPPTSSEQVGNTFAGKSMEEARLLGSGVTEEEIARASLYDAGRSMAEHTAVTPITKEETDKFYTDMFGPKDFGVETEEEKQKREKRDFIKQGLTGLTDGLTALANLYYTNKWAPNQKQTYQLPELQKRLYKERLERDKKLENFRAWQRSKAEKADERAWQEKLYNKKQEAAQAAADKKAKIDAQADEIKYLRDLGLIDARQAAELEKMKGKFEYDKELARINNEAAMDRVNAGGGGAKSTIRVPIGKDGEYAEYRKNDLTNPIVISQIYNSLPDDYRVRGKEKVWNTETKAMEYPYDENPSTQKMQEAIGKALSDGFLKEMAPEIKVGGSKKQSKTKHLDLD